MAAFLVSNPWTMKSGWPPWAAVLPVGVDLADRDHHLAPVAVDRVAVDVDVGEVVVLGDGLEVADAGPQHLGVPEADVVDRRPVGLQVLGG
jgi:hypothetical protein